MIKKIEHWLYKEARELWQFVQRGQIMKGEEKYPQPLGDAEWSWREVVMHAVEENVDQMHYITLLYTKLEQMEIENKLLKEEIERLKEGA